MNRCTQASKHTTSIITSAVLLASSLTPSALFSSSVFATDSAVSVNFQQDVGVSFTFNSTLQVNVSADLYINNLAPGTSSDSNIITVNVITNNAAGYTLNATVGNSTYNNRYLNHATASGARFNSIDYGSSLASLTTPSTWGFSYLDESLNNGTNTTWTNYSGLPLYTDTTNIATLKTTTEPPASATGDNIKFKIAANADSNQISGTYNNVINFTAVAATIPVTLSDAFSNAGATKYNGYYKMQDLTSTICGNTEVEGDGSITELIDVRDNTVYRVTKLADHNCWMLDNLALDLTSSMVQQNLNSTTTNASNATLAYLKGTSTRNPSNTPNGNYATGPVTKSWTSDLYSYSVPMIAVDSATSGLCEEPTTWCVNSNGTWSSTDVLPATINGNTSIAQGKIGIYYNYCAASAGSYCYGNGTSSTGSPSSDPNSSTLRDVTEDICPAGWHLPTSTNSSEIQSLYSAYSSNATNFQTALSTPLSGLFDSGVSLDQGSEGYYWSSTWRNTINFGIFTVSNSVSYAGVSSRIYGNSIRCVLSAQ